MDLEIFIIESAAWIVFAVLLIVLVGNRYDAWPWQRRRHNTISNSQTGYQQLV
jgi:hypothetical protein